MSNTLPKSTDVVIVGAGNAALCAALAAAESGVSVLVLERAPEGEAGGNSRFTAGAFRCVYDGVEDLKALMPDLTSDEVANTDFGTYTQAQFFDDMGRLTEIPHRPRALRNPGHAQQEHDAVDARQRHTLRPIYGRQAFKVDGKFKFWGGLTVESWGGGPGLVDALTKSAARAGITIAYQARALALISDDEGVKGVRLRHQGKTREIAAKCVVLAAGGFQANAEWRTRYMGAGWELAKVRGTRFNTGDGIRMALDVGAQPTGNWSGGHAVAWDRNAPEFGDLTVGDNFQKHNYPFRS
jgi:tricarballylate dehydrogenase